MELTAESCAVLAASFAAGALVIHCSSHLAHLEAKLHFWPAMLCPKSAEVQAAAWEVRSQNYLHFCQYLVHFAAMSTLWYAWDTLRNPGYPKIFVMGQFMAFWAQHHACLEGWIPLHHRSLRAISIAQYGAFLVFALGRLDDTQADAATALCFNTFQIVMRCMMVTIFADTTVAIPFQFLLSFLETAIFLQHYGSEAFFGFAVVQAITLGSICMISGLSEYWINSQTEALLESKAAVQSFRKMLRGLCDGEIVLDSELQICDGANCLERLLSKLHSKAFAQLLDPEQLESFQSFLEEKNEAMPACLRVSLSQGNHGGLVSCEDATDWSTETAAFVGPT